MIAFVDLAKITQGDICAFASSQAELAAPTMPHKR